MCLCVLLVGCYILILQNDVRQVVRPCLGAHLVFMYDFPFLIVDLLGLLVAEQQDNGPKQKDGRTPADAIGPANSQTRRLAITLNGIQVSGKKFNIKVSGYHTHG